jgi:ribosomal protein L29
MNKLSYNKFANITNFKEIQDNILNIEKKIFKLKIQKAKNEKISSHIFKFARREIAQLKFKFFQLQKNNIK